MRPARHRGAVRHAVVPDLGPQVPQQRLLGNADADALHPLVVPGPLHREQTEQAADEPVARASGGREGTHRNHATTVPPTTPAASQRRPGRRPTRRRVPAVPAPSAPPPACAALTAATVAGPCSG